MLDQEEGLRSQETRLDELGEREIAEQAVAVALSDLSMERQYPAGVEGTVPFAHDEVDFTCGAWLPFVRRVQDWLFLDETLDHRLDDEKAIQQLFRVLDCPKEVAPYRIHGDELELTDDGLEVLRDRVERAISLKDVFLEALAVETIEGATAVWQDAWEQPSGSGISGPIEATADVWPITEFAGLATDGRLDLNPPYQRGDVWSTKDSQLLIESVMRGIPLPSVILLAPADSLDAPTEIVDGKQRLTAILRFMGAHPKALDRVKKEEANHPGSDLLHLFQTNYPRFRRAWKNTIGETLTASKEREYYFPFKMSRTSRSLTGDLEVVRGKYFHEIKDDRIRVGDETRKVGELFNNRVNYRIPIIQYRKATPKQIHQVFELYNKQGKHLNAEEIRNAVFHDVDLLRAISVASGDQTDLVSVAPFLASLQPDVESIAKGLDEYGVSKMRYRRSKVLAWLLSIVLSDCRASDGAFRFPSTAQQIDSLLLRIQDSPRDPMRDHKRIERVLRLVSGAMDAHAAADGAWAPGFRNTGSATWQELQLIASLLGVTLAGSVLGSSLEDRLIAMEGSLGKKSSSWKRPKKTQTDTQWKYIAAVALGVLEELDVDVAGVDSALADHFGVSCIPALQAKAAATSE